MKVKAVGTASASLSGDRKGLAAAIQDAMSKAVLECYAEGIKDPVRMRERMMAARQAVVDKAREA